MAEGNSTAQIKNGGNGILKAVAFVDNENFIGLQKDMNLQIDLVRLMQLIIDQLPEGVGEVIWQAKYIYNRKPFPDRFDHFLNRSGFTVKVVEDDGLGAENLVDRAINKDLIDLTKESEVVVIVSGDGGHIDCLVQLAQEAKTIVVIGTESTINRSYYENPSFIIIDLAEFREVIGKSSPRVTLPNRTLVLTLRLTATAEVQAAIMTELLAIIRECQSDPRMAFFDHTLQDTISDRAARSKLLADR